jgi:CRP/FNR family nitrogen fixation transcriptional regulator
MQTAVNASRSFQPIAPPVLPPASRRPSEVPALGTARSFSKDSEIFAEGDRSTCFYKVVTGAVRTSKLLSDGRRQIDAFHLPGDIFGIETGDEHRVSAEALGEATVIAYRRCSLEAMLSIEGGFAGQVLGAMMRSLERAQEHMLLLGRKTAMERIANFLLELSARMAGDTLDLPMSRNDIADHLGLTIETVSRSLTKLEHEGLIELPAHRRSIVLRNKAALRRLDA